MRFIKIIDCNNHEHNLNTELIYDIYEPPTRTEKERPISNIHLNHKDDNYSFATFKTYESKSSLLKRLEEYK